MLEKYNVIFEDVYDGYDNEDEGEITYYFTCDKSILKDFLRDEYPEADGATISIAFPDNEIEARYGHVEISPYTDDGYYQEDYDWNDIDLSYEEIDRLIDMAQLEIRR